MRPSALIIGMTSAAVPVRKAFIRDVDIVPRDARFGNLDPEFRRDVEHDRTGDSAQRARA